ncbi:MAG: M3 family metallopeptidase [Pyrinomonadaceae bacterium]
MTISENEKRGAAGDKPFWTNEPDAETFAGIQEERLEKAQRAIDRMLAVEEKRTIENTLATYDEALLYLDAAREQSDLMTEVHPNAEFRRAAEKISQKVSAFATDLSLNREVFDAISALNLSDADAETTFYVEKILRKFRLAGVDKDAETRAKIKAINDELVLIGQEFARHIRDSKDGVVVENVSELDGLPPDFIANHQPDADGKITLTTDYPDAIPVMTYARSEDLRKRMYFAMNNKAYPENMPVLDNLAAKRFELANLLGYETWADYITADKMIKTAAAAADFIGKIVDVSGARARREYEELLERKRQDFPDATEINRWESAYYSELARRQNYNFDSQTVRPYFPYERVKQGVLDVTGKLFGVEFRQVENASVWHPSVECWEMFENEKLVGRFYLDMHPREGKFNHAAQFGVKTGVAGKQIPEAALVCNFSGGDKGDAGLMEFGDMRTFFHEFGHLLHTLFGGHQKWIGVSGVKTEWDFVEAPSQMLEEWTLDAATLQTFARHYETGEPIPAELVNQMKRAEEFGKGLQVRQQMAYARLSLSIYDRSADEVNTDALVREISEKYSPYPFVEGTHLQTSFGHLDGYSAIYYTYMWSLVIAKDLFSRFDKNDLLAPAVAKNYRRTILEAGGSRPAETLVENFLGRKSNFTAYQNWLDDDAGANN